MLFKAFGYLAQWLDGFFGLYAQLDIVLGISAAACIAIALWSITRFLVLPLVGGAYSIDDGERDILTETVTETNTESVTYPKQHIGGGAYRRRSVTQNTTKTRSHRKKVK